MLDVKLKADSALMADYLRYLFPPERDGGPLMVTATNSVGRLMVAHCRAVDRPVGVDGDHVLDLVLPRSRATQPLDGKFLHYTAADTAAVNMAVKAVFDIEFRLYYVKGLELGFQKKDIITAFIISRGLMTTDCFDALHKRAYRHGQRTMERLTEKLLQKVYYIDTTLNIKGLTDDKNH